MDSQFTSLSGGWRSRCSLATSLLVKSDILLLDEPSNFLVCSLFFTTRSISSPDSLPISSQDLDAIIWLEQFLTSEARTLVLISHDQVFLDNVAEETIVLRNKTLRYFEGTPRTFQINEKKERKKLIGQKEAMDKKKEHVSNILGLSI